MIIHFYPLSHSLITHHLSSMPLPKLICLEIDVLISMAHSSMEQRPARLQGFLHTSAASRLPGIQLHVFCTAPPCPLCLSPYLPSVGTALSLFFLPSILLIFHDFCAYFFSGLPKVAAIHIHVFLWILFYFSVVCGL